MKYLKYDRATGQIVSWGTTNKLRPGMVTHLKDGSLADFWYDPDRGIVPKEQGELAVPGPTPADGESVARIGGLPHGTRCTFEVSGRSYLMEVNDSALELVLHTPQTVTVTFWHPRWRHDPVEMAFV